MSTLLLNLLMMFTVCQVLLAYREFLNSRIYIYLVVEINATILSSIIYIFISIHIWIIPWFVIPLYIFPIILNKKKRTQIYTSKVKKKKTTVRFGVTHCNRIVKLESPLSFSQILHSEIMLFYLWQLLNIVILYITRPDM